MVNPSTVEELLDYWPGNIPFKGSLVSDDGCMCAQGQALHFLDNYSPSDLRNITQETADKRVAELFGISRTHSVLLRIVNDRQDGAPSCVIRNPEQVLGDQAHVVLALWRHLERMTAKDWHATQAAAWASVEARSWVAASTAASAAALAAGWGDACAAAWQAARHASWPAAWHAARAAADATNEIQGGAVMRANGLPFFFLPLLGFADPEAVIAADSK